jgi:hypothetical protein
VLAFTFVWLTAKRNVKISITQTGLEISHDEDVVRFAWCEVKRAQQPAMLRRYWLFELKNTKKIKIPTQYFSRKQNKQFKRLITSATTARVNQVAATGTRINHPRVIDSSHR